jgi:aspartyl-tRNA(Asn)/glutamyl-tRNA(Gln) amidotransferase subunit B
LSDFDVETLTSTRELALWFEEAAAGSKDPKRTANIILTELLADLNTKNQTINDVTITPKHISALVNAIDSGRITSQQGKVVFEEMMKTNKMPDEIIKEKGMEVVSDTGAIEAIVDKVIAANEKAVADYKGGKTNVLGFLTGQVMKESHGKANPKTAAELVQKKLSQA